MPITPAFGPARLQRRVTAYHEMGHAIVGHFLEHADPVHKISIISRGAALGYTVSLPSEDRLLTTRAQLSDTMAMTLGGRAAEQIVFGELTTGASNDLEQVTATARQMVMRFGMSETLGPRVFGHDRAQPFLGRQHSTAPDYSHETAGAIDDEIRLIVDAAHERAEGILLEHRDALTRIAEILLDRETIERAQFEALLAGDDEHDVFGDDCTMEARQPESPWAAPSTPVGATGKVNVDADACPRSSVPWSRLMGQVSATRSELLARRARIRLAAQGRDLLKERRSALVHEFNRLGASALASIDLLDRDAADAGRFLGMSVAAQGQEPVESAASAAQGEVELSLCTRSVAGVPIVEISKEPVARARTDRGYSLAATSARLDEVAERFEAVLDRLLDLAVLELSVRRLADEIARTTRRMNALEHVVVPRLESERARIALVLEEREMEDRVRLRRMRSRGRREGGRR